MMNKERQAVLIVDDNPTNIQILNEILSPTYTVFFATNGLDALGITDQEHPDLILLDIMMPEMDGYEVCRRLKDNPKTSATPVIFVTAMAEVEDETKGLELGAVDYFTKPVSASIVKARVKNHLNLVEKTNEAQKAYSELKASQSQLLHQEKMASIGQLADGIAHEINTPTQYVSTNTEFLQEAFSDLIRLIDKQNRLIDAAENGEPLESLIIGARETAEETDLTYLSDEIPTALDQSLVGLRRIKEIVSAMKEFSHPDTEEKSLVDINNVIRSTVEVSRNIWQDNAELIMTLDQYLPMIAIVPGELNQVILNLIVNAAHAVSDAASVSTDGMGSITVSTCQTTDRVEISISDTGSGIASDNMSRVFEPFFTTKDVGNETGLGLSIAYDIIKKHGGELTVQSELGKGAEFTIRLPTK